MTGAIHRFDRVLPIIRFDGKHVITEFIGVTTTFPQREIDHLRRLDFLIAFIKLCRTHITFNRTVNRPAFRVPKHHARRFVLQVKEVKLLADATMVSFLRFGQVVQIRLELFGLCKCSTVDALQHDVV